MVHFDSAASPKYLSPPGMPMSLSSVLIVTQQLDPHADAVIDYLETRGVACLRLNTAELLQDYTVSCDLTQGEAIEISDRWGRTVSTAGLRGAYYRKPVPVGAHPEVAEGAAAFSASEAEEFLRNLYNWPGLRWVNHPQSIKRAQVKLPQLLLATRLGLRIPRTLITTDVDRARAFVRACPNGALCKPLISTGVVIDGTPLQIWSHRLTDPEIDQVLDTVALAPTQLQEYVEKKYEVRATVIGAQVMAVKIDSQKVERAHHDWRQVDPFTIPHEPLVLPTAISSALLEFTRSYDLQYSAFDLICTPDDEFVFLENNPNGQYYWIELITGIPMAAAVSELLIS
jgi:glutathione synthase/RimK-type ligase-like ATP-grasp enzyme